MSGSDIRLNMIDTARKVRYIINPGAPKHTWLTLGEPNLYAGPLFRDGSFKAHMVDIISDYLDDKSVLCDIGANIGVWTIPLSRKCHSVIAFEGDKLSRGLLYANLALNGAGNVKIHSRDPVTTLDKHKYDVQFIRIDSSVFNMELVVKLDDIINRCRPTIFFEGDGHNEVVKHFDSLNYRIYKFKSESAYLSIAEEKIANYRLAVNKLSAVADVTNQFINLAQTHYDKGEHAVALKYLANVQDSERSLRLKSISYYYTGNKSESLKAADKLVLSRNNNARQLDLSNRLFSVYRHNGIIKNLDVSLRLAEDKNNYYKPLNPSIIKWKDGYLMSLRSVNYLRQNDVFKIHDPTGTIRSINYLLSLDNNFDIINVVSLEDVSNARHYTSKWIGFEDIRLIDDSSFLATMTELNERNVPEVCYCKFKDNFVYSVVPLRLGPVEKAEKNWLPLRQDDKYLYVLYGYDPIRILKVNKDDGDISIYKEYTSSLKLDIFRGSCAMKCEDGYYVLVHEVVKTHLYNYTQRLLELDDDFNLTAMSYPFSFTGAQIEFPAGMVRNGDDIVFSVGLMDREAKLIKIKTKDLTDSLYPLTEWNF